MVKSKKTIPVGHDPRLDMDEDALNQASLNAMPQVAKAGKGGDMGLILGFIACLGLGAMTLLFMNNGRNAAQQPTTPAASSPLVASQSAPSTLPPIDSSVGPIEPLNVPQPQPPAPMITPAPTPLPVQPMQADANARAPALIFDQSAPEGTAAPAANAPAASALNANDQFLARNSDVSQRAIRIGKPSQVVAQGTIIPAVMETAINSDLPGFTRAVVSRDVRSFDGTRVLIPRGSRLIGQYKSGLAAGETRAFIVWSRLIRPDGLSIQLASPAVDEMGQAGMSGRVDNHFFKRFGASALLSIINGVASSANKGGNTIVIGSTEQAQGIASEALKNNANIPPTIKVPQGTVISVFAARDLDFSAGDEK